MPRHVILLLTKFGQLIGLAYQITDDILDETQSSDNLGKTAKKDSSVNKATYPSVFGLSKSREIANELTVQACTFLKPLKRRSAILKALADILLKARSMITILQ